MSLKMHQHTILAPNKIKVFCNKSDISYLKTSQALDVLIHSGKPYTAG